VRHLGKKGKKLSPRRTRATNFHRGEENAGLPNPRGNPILGKWPGNPLLGNPGKVESPNPGTYYPKNISGP